MWNRIVLYDEELVNDEQSRAGAERRNESLADRSVHRLLRQALREEDAPQGANCLDPETVAAWMDGALAADVLATAEGHAAGCARCQAVLSAMARTAPPIARRSWWPASLTLRWLVPAAAAAATAVAVWIAVVPPGNRPDATAPSSEIDRLAARPEPSLASPPPPAAPAPVPGSAPATAREAPPPPARAFAKSRPVPEEFKEDKNKALDERAKSEVQAPELLDARRDRSETEKPADKVVAQARKQEEFRRQAAAAPPVDAPAAGRAAETPAPPIASVAGFRAGRGAVTEIVSPDPASRWRIGAAGVVHRSTDAGVTFATQQTGIKTELLAGSSPARDVCWIVGRGGVVLLSTDGRTWQRRPFAEAIDLVAVSAADAKTATITTSDGRRFSTTDGGATWSGPLLQESPAAPF
jgi:hypothetical protein